MAENSWALSSILCRKQKQTECIKRQLEKKNSNHREECSSWYSIRQSVNHAKLHPVCPDFLAAEVELLYNFRISQVD
uniref:Uncharacterized protein n=1 Tax=Oryza brachyantha TaxID=4533 RepID=J3N596_ORYBR